MSDPAVVEGEDGMAAVYQSGDLVEPGFFVVGEAVDEDDPWFP